MSPSGPLAIPAPPDPGMVNSVMTPAGLIRAIFFATLVSQNQTFPSGPGAIPLGMMLGVGTGNSLIPPAVVIRPTLLAVVSRNQILPSGPAVMELELLLG